MTYRGEIPPPKWVRIAVDITVAAAFVTIFFAALALCAEIERGDCPAGDHYSTYNMHGELVCRDGERQ